MSVLTAAYFFFMTLILPASRAGSDKTVLLQPWAQRGLQRLWKTACKRHQGYKGRMQYY